MSEKTKQLDKHSFRANLDGEIRTLSSRSVRSLSGLFAHLESLGSRHEPGPIPAPDTDRAARSREVMAKSQPSAAARLKRIRFRELGRQLIRTAKSQVRVLRARTQEVQSLVLINNWAVADRLWSGLAPDCKTPLFVLCILEELWGINPGRPEADDQALARQWQQFILIQAEVEILLARRQSLLELSDTLETQLGLWLKRFDELLEELDEESMA